MTKGTTAASPAVLPGSAGQPPARRGDGIALLVLLLVTLAARAATFGNPVVGFDEQFYLLVGDRMLHGALPFVDIFDRKPVGIFLIYAAARLLGGDGFVQYKLVAAASVVATAYLLYRTARHRAGPVGATLAAILYILWLNFMEGEGGQTPVFYNPLVLGAGALLLAAARSPAGLIRRGSGALLLIGIALQIKYSVVVEGVFFGCAFLVLARTYRLRWGATALFGGGMIALALLPTLSALVYYWQAGHLDAFVFCNFVSLFGQGKGSFLKQLGGLAGITGLMLPLIVVGLAGRSTRAADAPPRETWFLRAWLGASVLGVLVYWRFNSPHYALPLLLPACLMIAPALAGRRRLGLALATVAFAAGQVVLVASAALKGSAPEARALAAIAAPRRHCIFVYDGYPALYMLAHSCLPSRWAFPGHLNAADEASARALGVDPTLITRRILATHPDAIVDTYPVFKYGNPATHALVEQTIRARYALVACVITPRGRARLVYRPRDDGSPRDVARCPAAVLHGPG